MNLSTALEPIRRVVKKVWWIEFLTLGNVAVTVAFLRLHHLRIDWRGFSYIVKPLVMSLPYFLAGGVIATVLVRAVLDRSFRPILSRLQTPGYYVVWLRLWIVLILSTYCYGWLKVNVPIVNPRLWDEQLWTLDTYLLGGFSPSLFLTALFDGSVFTGWIDYWYNFWARTLMAMIIFVSAFHKDDERRTFITAKIILWSLGAWLYVAMPALGPVYAFPEVWHQSVGIYPRALGMQMKLWANYQSLQEGIALGRISGINPTRGVAAMPSLHVGTHVLFALWAWSKYRPLFIFFLLGTLFTFVGSILTGWHYAIDGIVGAGLAFIALYLARRLDSRERTEPSGDEAVRREVLV